MNLEPIKPKCELCGVVQTEANQMGWLVFTCKRLSFEAMRSDRCPDCAKRIAPIIDGFFRLAPWPDAPCLSPIPTPEELGETPLFQEVSHV